MKVECIVKLNLRFQIDSADTDSIFFRIYVSVSACVMSASLVLQSYVLNSSVITDTYILYVPEKGHSKRFFHLLMIFCYFNVL